MRHLAVADLWVQERLRSGDFALSKVPGSENPADLMTKFIDKPVMDKLLPLINVETEDGRADSAPQLTCMVNRLLILQNGAYHVY